MNKKLQETRFYSFSGIILFKTRQDKTRRSFNFSKTFRIFQESSKRYFYCFFYGVCDEEGINFIGDCFSVFLNIRF